MFPSQLKLLLIGSVLAAAFVSGWLVNGWRLEAQHVDALEALTEKMQEKLIEQADAFKEAAETLRLRETQLAQDLSDERDEVERLEDEIENTPVVTRTVNVPVAGECPACAAIDSLRFRTLYNRAATGAVSDTGPSISAMSDPDNPQ